ncbi:MAG: hypothetical protein NTV62_00255, partial [Candidatus Gribaldobacteria bacterium]|nr:hypothetical protein [Candidatus Gribaldobacteria bacterium]
MATQLNNKISLSKATILKEKGMVILPLREYKKLCEDAAIMTYHLKGKEAEKLDCLVQDGINGYKAGKCKMIKSLAD